MNLQKTIAALNLRFTIAKTTRTVKGLRLRRTAEPTQAFWQLWERHKDELKAVGYTVRKTEDNRWELCHWKVPRKPHKGAALTVQMPTTGVIDPAGLLEYQIAPAQRLLAALQLHGGVLDSSDTGTGKTFVALACGRAVGLPIVVVAPKAVIPSWLRAAEHMRCAISVLNYEKLRNGSTDYYSTDPATKQGMWMRPCLVIFDEAHRCKGEYTQNAEMMITARRQQFPVIALSATSATSPLEMRALGFLLGLHNLHDYGQWARAHGVVDGRFGAEFRGGPAAMSRIHSNIFPERGVRVRIADLGKAFPETQIATELINLNGATNRIDVLYAEMEQALKELHAKRERDGYNPLTVILRARQEIELLKVPGLVSIASDKVEEGMRVAIFVSFADSLREIERKLTEDGAVCVTIHGDQSAPEREYAIALFQSGKAQVCIANINAGGIGISLHDTTGAHPRFALVSPGWSAVQLRQALGRVHRAGGKSKSIQRIVFVANSVEERVANTLTEKLHNLDALNDADVGG